MSSKVAIIPARGGSKRIPRKNIKSFCGKPMILWTLEKLQEFKIFDRIIVSTDDEEIAAISREAGVDVPFMRPDELADDFATTAVVLEHAIEWLAKNDIAYDYACCAYPTSVFVTEDALKAGLRAVEEEQYDSAMAVCSFSYPIQRSLSVNDAGCLEFMQPDFALARSNDLPEAFHDAAMFYWLNASVFLKTKTILGEKTAPVYVSRKHVVDIDTAEDFDFAESLFTLLNKSNPKEHYES